MEGRDESYNAHLTKFMEQVSKYDLHHGIFSDAFITTDEGTPDMSPSTVGETPQEDVDPNFILTRAAFLGLHDIVPALIGLGAKGDFCDLAGRNAMHYAVAGGNFEVVKILLENWLETFEHSALPKLIDAADPKQWTPLHIAVAKNHPQIVEILLKHGADIRKQIGHICAPCRTRTMSEPIHLAAIQCNQKTTQMLLNAGADVNQLDSTSRTPLHYAAFRDKGEYFEYLLRIGAKVDVLDEMKRSPLHIAASTGRLQYAKILVERGCQVSGLDIFDMTPRDIAAARGETTMVRLMETLELEAGVSLKNPATDQSELEETVVGAIVAGLEEQDVEQIRRGVKRLGPKICLAAFRETLVVQQHGGVMTQDGTRLKAKGGVYFSKIKAMVTEGKISKQDWDYIRADLSERRKAELKRKSRQRSSPQSKKHNRGSSFK